MFIITEFEQTSRRPLTPSIFFSVALAHLNVAAINDLHLGCSCRTARWLVKRASNGIKERNERRLDSSISREKCAHCVHDFHSAFLSLFFSRNFVSSVSTKARCHSIASLTRHVASTAFLLVFLASSVSKQFRFVPLTRDRLISIHLINRYYQKLSSVRWQTVFY